MTTARQDTEDAQSIDNAAGVTTISRALRSISVEVEPDRRSVDPIQRLSREFDAACTQAVTPHQIAALLEAEGLNDRIVRARYGADDVFSLARTLHDLVPLRVDGEAESRLPTGIAPPRRSILLRGPLYLLPLIFFALAGTYFAAPSVAVAGLLALLAAWVWNQGSGTLIHRLVGRGQAEASRATALASLGAGVVIIPIATVPFGSLVDGSTGLALGFVIGQTVYLLSASTLLVFGLDRTLMATAGAGLAILAGALATGVPEPAVLAAAASMPAFVGTAALWSCRSADTSGLRSLGAVDLRLATTMAMVGAMWAGIIGAGALPLVDGDDAILTLSVAASGMVLSMGYAEWLIIRLRIDATARLQSTADPATFAQSVRRSLAEAAIKLALAVILTTSVVAGGASLADRFPLHAWLLAGAYVVLSVAFFSGLALVITGRATTVLALSALVLLQIVVAMAIVPNEPLGSDIVYLLGCGTLAIVFTWLASRALTDPVVHR